MAFHIITVICELCCPSASLLQEKVRAVFDNLIQLEHLNIVKFHKYWADVKENKARVRFFCLVFLEFSRCIYRPFCIQRLKLGNFELKSAVAGRVGFHLISVALPSKDGGSKWTFACFFVLTVLLSLRK
jgi:hypothetical protein